jgi:hypothetical protein
MSNAVPLDIVREVRQACLCLAAQRAARTLARRFDRAFQHLGLTNGQFSLMMPLNAPEPMKLGQLATFLAMGGGAICVGIDFGAISSKMRLSDHAARSIA